MQRASDYGLKIGVVWWLLGMALASGYTIFTYRSFAGKVRAKSRAKFEGLSFPAVLALLQAQEDKPDPTEDHQPAQRTRNFDDPPRFHHDALSANLQILTLAGHQQVRTKDAVGTEKNQQNTGSEDQFGSHFRRV